MDAAIRGCETKLTKPAFRRLGQAPLIETMQLARFRPTWTLATAQVAADRRAEDLLLADIGIESNSSATQAKNAKLEPHSPLERKVTAGTDDRCQPNGVRDGITALPQMWAQRSGHIIDVSSMVGSDTVFEQHLTAQAPSGPANGSAARLIVL
jgi:hypothetical protein